MPAVMGASRHNIGKENANICSTYSQIADIALALSLSSTDRFNFI